MNRARSVGRTRTDLENTLETAPGSVCVVGLGYIGLPTAAALATRGVDVIGVDVNAGIVETINAGRAPFVEPDLAVAVSGAVAMGRLRAVEEPEPADAFIVAVPTPFRDDKTADLSFIDAAAASVAPVLKTGDLVVLESTSPPGTTVRLSQRLAEHRPDLTFPHTDRDSADVLVAHCPERVLPGRIMIELVTNARIVGGLSPSCAKAAESLYRVFTQGDIVVTDATSAEVAKVAENAFRDVNIGFANELSMVCDNLQVDVHEVIELANRHPRVSILNPGPGVGGHCIAVDPWFLIAAAPDMTPLMRAARQVNDGKAQYVVAQIAKTAGRFRDPVIACLGLAFKANVDDLRESPALEIAEELSHLDVGQLLVVEPHISQLPPQLAEVDGARLCGLNEALADADIVALLVDHDQFRGVKEPVLRGKVVFDTRGIWHG
jgi:UDP-N-acetyl-D-mannosaminuronic acid dehydrogenase